MKTLMSLIAGASLFAFAGAASAQDPVPLTIAQMDGVHAGVTATSIVNAALATIGVVLSDQTLSVTTNTVSTPFPAILAANTFLSTQIAVGGLGQPASASMIASGAASLLP
jgi:hypothetical protein